MKLMLAFDSNVSSLRSSYKLSFFLKGFHSLEEKNTLIKLFFILMNFSFGEITSVFLTNLLSVEPDLQFKIPNLE